MPAGVNVGGKPRRPSRVVLDLEEESRSIGEEGISVKGGRSKEGRFRGKLRPCRQRDKEVS